MIQKTPPKNKLTLDILTQVDEVMSFVRKHINKELIITDKFYMEGDQRISLRDKIFREIVANMLIHREYTNAFPSTFIIYNEMVETKNANKPHVYGLLFPNTFQSFPKNPNIAQLFTQMERSEELGTGIRNVYKYSKAYSGSDRIVFSEEDVFISKVPLYRVHGTDFKSGELNGKLNTGQKSVYKCMKNHEGMNTSLLSQELKMPFSTVDKHIRVLIKKNLIDRRGSRKTGGYYLVINK